MADRRIADFPTLEQAQGTDLILVSSENETYNITFATLKEGTHGDPGVGIDSYTDYYAVNNSTTPPADSAFSTTVVNPTSSNRYLWGYTVIGYSDTSQLVTDKHVLAVYGERGATGYYVTDITNYYVRSANKTGVTRTGTSGWSTTVPELTESYPYLWSYTRFKLNDNSYQYSTACVVGSLGQKGDTGSTGATGNGISSIAKTGTSGLVDTYTVTMTNGTTTTFTVTNGAKGDTGATGATGNGIASITKTGTSGLVDTYTVTMTNGTTTTFTVTNGAGVPSGGSSGQVLKKNSGTDYDVAWANESSGSTWGSITGTLSNQTDLQNAITAVTCLTVDCGTISSLPATISNASITSDMVVLRSELGTPASQGSDWTITTSNGSVNISGTISGNTTLKLYIAKSR